MSLPVFFAWSRGRRARSPTRCARVVAAGLALSLPSFADDTRAEPRVGLAMDAGPGTESCVSRAELQSAVEVQLGHGVFVPPDDASAEAIVRVKLSRGAPGFRATVAIENRDARDANSAAAARELVTAEDCRALDEQLVLVVALLADASAAEPAEEPATVPEPPLEPPVPEPPVDDTSPVSTAPGWESAQQGRFSFAFDAGAVLGVGVLPKFGVGAELGFGVAPPQWPLLRLGLMAFAPGSAEVEPGARLDFMVGSAGLAVCPQLVRGAAATLRACLGGDLVVRRAESHGLTDGRSNTRLTTQGSFALRLGIPLGAHWHATGLVGAALVSRLDRYSYRTPDGLAEAFEPAFLPIFFGLGLAYESP